MWLFAIIAILLIYYLYCNKTIVYRFYRPTCGYCTSTQDDWDSFKFNGITSLIFGYDVNLDDEDEDNLKLARKYKVNSVPTIIAVLPDGTANVYNGNRSADDILAWARMS